MAVYQIASGHHITFRSSLYSQSASCVADIILVVFSLRLLWNVNLPTPQRRMILAIFSSSMIMSLLFVSCDHPDSIVETIAMNLEVKSCLLSHSNPKFMFLCPDIVLFDLLVVVTYAYRVLNRKPDDPER